MLTKYNMSPKPKIICMPIEQHILEMEGKISLLDNKKFLYFAGLIGIYYIAYIGFMTYLLVQSGGFH